MPRRGTLKGLTFGGREGLGWAAPRYGTFLFEVREDFVHNVSVILGATLASRRTRVVAVEPGCVLLWLGDVHDEAGEEIEGVKVLGFGGGGASDLGVVGDLAIIWVKPRSAANAVEVAHSAGCSRVWFSFGTGQRDAVARAYELGMEVVEIGRCPVYYLDEKPRACAAHTLMVKATGSYRRPPHTDSEAKRREL